MIKGLIRRPIAVTMTLLAVVILGFISLRYLPVSLMPSVDIPHISVHVSAPGLSVREVNDELLRPLKNQLSQVVGLSDISTQARSDAGVVQLSFEAGCDMDIAFIEVNEKMDRASQSLPEDIERPRITKANVTDIPAFYLNISMRRDRDLQEGELPVAGVDFVNLGLFVRDVISKRIEQLPECAIADISGIITPELLCIPNVEMLTSMNMTIDNLSQEIERNNLTLSALSIRDGEYRYNIQFDAQLTSKEDIESIYINHNGRLYLFKDLCQVIERPAMRSGLVRSGVESAVSVAVIKQSDARMSDLQESIGELIEQLRQDYPSLLFELTRDQTELLSYSISSLSTNLILGAILAAIIIFIFMGDLRSPLLIIITIPLALIITLLMLYVVGISINIISLSGLILGVGMMVDNSIIVIDNIVQRWSGGTPLEEAISEAVGEVTTPMLSSILTTCSVFLPLIFLSGVAGALFYDQAITVTIALFSSFAVSLLVLPVYFYALYKRRAKVDKLFTSHINIYRPYEAVLGWSLRHSGVVMLLFALLIPSTYLVYTQVKKSELPDISYSDTMLLIDWSSGISLEESDRRVAELLTLVSDRSQQTTSMIGSQQFMMSHTPTLTTSEAAVYIKAHSREEIESIESTIVKYTQQHYPQCVVKFETSGNIFDMIFASNLPPLVIDLKPKESSAPKVEDVMRVMGAIQEALPDQYIPNPLLEDNIIYIANIEAMALYGVSYEQIHSKMGSVVSQNSLFKISRGGYSIPVVTGEARAQEEDILRAKVRSSEGVDIPLSLLLEKRRGEDFKTLYSSMGGDFYPIYINCDEDDVEPIIEIVEDIVKRDGSFFTAYRGEYFSSREMIGELIIILIVAIALLYFILAAQFESIIQPLIILLEIVIDIFFVLGGLYILGESLNIMSLIGIVVMSGIIINDSILKVDTINRLRRQGVSLLRAIYVGGHRRLKPIIMTSLTTIFAILPLLRRVDMGSDLQYPLSLTIIIGMLFGTLVSLFFIPLVYYIIYRKRG